MADNKFIKGEKSETEPREAEQMAQLDQSRKDNLRRLADYGSLQSDAIPDPGKINLEPMASFELVELPNGLRNVYVRDLPNPEGIQGPEDFKKIPLKQMEAGLRRLEEMRSAIESGEGTNEDYWYARDQEQGLGPADGYQAAYRAFYGESAVTLDKVGDQYRITDGAHRIWAAKRMGVDILPARIFEHS